ncbi:acetylxylan esterase [Arenibacter sp. F26102]|uniref:alpha/beta hydrolase family protein n=1 Tax=Arenibacter sp. F26102 TaxID=2926416 RepID=UPI001FF65551|nr:acetylxylan esterase [Arenibacter sp. F26102]MCK0146701.1 acetylxylan esterase [Arenibacter sp. F26102]
MQLKSRTMKYAVKFLLLFCILTQQVGAQEDLSFFEYWKSYSDIENSLFKHFSSIAYGQLEQTKSEASNLQSPEDWLERQSIVKNKLLEAAGPFPEKTPLNVQITDVLNKDGFRIEKIIYESVPNNFITGALYVPDGVKKNAPTIFYACGHSREGFRVEIYQHIIINLVKKGFVVFTIDPMGQGERYEYWDEQLNQSILPIPDHEHSYAGAQCLISGYSTACYFIWDVIRGIDYLLTRKEVDPNRLGMTGRSGGGNLTAYIGALDDRVLATAPECYITSYEYLYRSRGPQCAEQNLYQMVGKGLDHADFIQARAPKPTFIISTTRDFFSIQGTRETFQEVKTTYAALGKPQNLSMIEDDAIHQSTKKNREAMYAFFQKELDNPGSNVDMEVTIPTVKELQITKTGQLNTSFNKETIFSLNKAKVDKQEASLLKQRSDYSAHLNKIIVDAKQISGFEAPSKYGNTIFSGRNIDNRILEKYLVSGSGDYKLPVALLKPLTNTKNEVVLYFDTKGLEHAIQQDSIVSGILNKGYTVLVADLPGIGELGPGYLKGDSYINEVSYNQWFGANLTGNSFVGLRTEDILRVLHFAENELNTTNIAAISNGALGSELLHAAAFNKNIKKVALIYPFLSYIDIATTKLYNSSYIPHTVSGAIEKYDLPDLMASLYPRKVLIVDPKSGDGKPASKSKIEYSLKFPLEVYKKKGDDNNMVISNNVNENQLIVSKLLTWLE